MDKKNLTVDTPLDRREQVFAEKYRGNASQAALEAGCTPASAGTMGWRMYGRPHVRAEIERLSKLRTDAAVMDREEMQRLFSATARDAMLPVRDRLFAAQLLGKTRGDFSEKLEVKGELSLLDLVRESAGKKTE